MKERPIPFSGPMVRAILEGRKTQTRRVAKYFDVELAMQFAPRFENGWWKAAHKGYECRCPYGQPGDLLWVKETIGLTTSGTDEHPAVVYRASNPEFVLKWKRYTFMPRWASRLTLELTGVRVERLQEISEADAEAEGAKPINEFDTAGHPRYHRAGFRDIWASINATKHPWASNPWVWVLEFRRLA